MDNVGCGVVIGSGMGSGELINTPAQAAKFGIVLLWAVILACLIKFFLQVEFGRHALVHGRTPFQAFNSLPGLKIKKTSWIGLLYMGIFVFTVLTLPGMMTAIAGMLSEIIPVHEWAGIEQKSLVRPWAILVAFLTWLVLFRGYYDSMEKLIMVAPPRFLGHLRDKLDAPTAKLVIHSLSKDLTKADCDKITDAVDDLR